MMTTNKELPYRPCVGAMLINLDHKVFVAKRTDSSGDYWQMPQGGIDEGEIPIEALMRELLEEIGTDKVQIIVESKQWRTYDLPDDLIGKLEMSHSKRKEYTENCRAAGFKSRRSFPIILRNKLIGVRIMKYIIAITIGAIILPNNSPNFTHNLFRGVKVLDFNKPNIKKAADITKKK